MIENYFELKFYKNKNNKYLFYILTLLITFLVFLSRIKINKYVNFKLLKINNIYYIKCENHCSTIMNRNTIQFDNHNLTYKFKSKMDNLYEINILDKNEINNNADVKIPLKKQSVHNALFNIFKRKE